MDGRRQVGILYWDDIGFSDDCIIFRIDRMGYVSVPMGYRML